MQVETHVPLEHVIPEPQIVPGFSLLVPSQLLSTPSHTSVVLPVVSLHVVAVFAALQFHVPSAQRSVSAPSHAVFGVPPVSVPQPPQAFVTPSSTGPSQSLSMPSHISIISPVLSLHVVAVFAALQFHVPS